MGEAAMWVEAVEKAELLLPDLIVLDLALPKLHGLELARRIRKVSPECKILFVSQESSSDVVQEALRLGAPGYVVKTHVASELLPRWTQCVRENDFQYWFVGGSRPCPPASGTPQTSRTAALAEFVNLYAFPAGTYCTTLKYVRK